MLLPYESTTPTLSCTKLKRTQQKRDQTQFDPAFVESVTSICCRAVRLTARQQIDVWERKNREQNDTAKAR